MSNFKIQIMKRILCFLLLTLIFENVNAQNTVSINIIDSLQYKIEQMQLEVDQANEYIQSLVKLNNDLTIKVKNLEGKIANIAIQNAKRDSQIELLNGYQYQTQVQLDTLLVDHNNLVGKQQQDKEYLTTQIDVTKQDVEASNEVLSNRSLLGILCIILIIVAISVIAAVFRRRIKLDTISIDEVRKTQATLQKESLKLDNKLLEVVEKQLSTWKNHAPSCESASGADHSLALKIADEIVRIEANLSRMDASVKGHKQLSKAVERIRNNFSANGYEIVDMLGKPYIEGMKAAVTFITDESLAPGAQIITKIIKPQINYRQEMIQAAQIEVSQPE